MSIEVSDTRIESAKIEMAIYNKNGKRIGSIIKKFEELARNDEKLKEHFKGTSLEEDYYKINVAGNVIADINFNNIRNLALNINEQEEIPYSKEQQALIAEMDVLIMERKELLSSLQENYIEEDIEI